MPRLDSSSSSPSGDDEATSHDSTEQRKTHPTFKPVGESTKGSNGRNPWKISQFETYSTLGKSPVPEPKPPSPIPRVPTDMTPDSQSMAGLRRTASLGIGADHPDSPPESLHKKNSFDSLFERAGLGSSEEGGNESRSGGPVGASTDVSSSEGTGGGEDLKRGSTSAAATKAGPPLAAFRTLETQMKGGDEKQEDGPSEESSGDEESETESQKMRRILYGSPPPTVSEEDHHSSRGTDVSAASAMRNRSPNKTSEEGGNASSGRNNRPIDMDDSAAKLFAVGGESNSSSKRDSSCYVGLQNSAAGLFLPGSPRFSKYNTNDDGHKESVGDADSSRGAAGVRSQGSGVLDTVGLSKNGKHKAPIDKNSSSSHRISSDSNGGANNHGSGIDSSFSPSGLNSKHSDSYRSASATSMDRSGLSRKAGSEVSGPYRSAAQSAPQSRSSKSGSAPNSNRTGSDSRDRSSPSGTSNSQGKSSREVSSSARSSIPDISGSGSNSPSRSSRLVASKSHQSPSHSSKSRREPVGPMDCVELQESGNTNMSSLPEPSSRSLVVHPSSQPTKQQASDPISDTRQSRIAPSLRQDVDIHMTDDDPGVRSETPETSAKLLPPPLPPPSADRMNDSPKSSLEKAQRKIRVTEKQPNQGDLNPQSMASSGFIPDVEDPTTSRQNQLPPVTPITMLPDDLAPVRRSVGSDPKTEKDQLIATVAGIPRVALQVDQAAGGDGRQLGERIHRESTGAKQFINDVKARFISVSAANVENAWPSSAASEIPVGIAADNLIHSETKKTEFDAQRDTRPPKEDPVNVRPTDRRDTLKNPFQAVAETSEGTTAVLEEGIIESQLIAESTNWPEPTKAKTTNGFIAYARELADDDWKPPALTTYGDSNYNPPAAIQERHDPEAFVPGEGLIRNYTPALDPPQVLEATNDSGIRNREIQNESKILEVKAKLEKPTTPPISEITVTSPADDESTLGTEGVYLERFPNKKQKSIPGAAAANPPLTINKGEKSDVGKAHTVEPNGAEYLKSDYDYYKSWINPGNGIPTEKKDDHLERVDPPGDVNLFPYNPRSLTVSTLRRDAGKLPRILVDRNVEQRNMELSTDQINVGVNRDILNNVSSWVPPGTIGGSVVENSHTVIYFKSSNDSVESIWAPPGLARSTSREEVNLDARRVYIHSIMARKRSKSPNQPSPQKNQEARNQPEEKLARIDFTGTISSPSTAQSMSEPSERSTSQPSASSRSPPCVTSTPLTPDSSISQPSVSSHQPKGPSFDSSRDDFTSSAASVPIESNNASREKTNSRERFARNMPPLLGPRKVGSSEMESSSFENVSKSQSAQTLPPGLLDAAARDNWTENSPSFANPTSASPHNQLENLPDEESEALKSRGSFHRRRRNVLLILLILLLILGGVAVAAVLILQNADSTDNSEETTPPTLPTGTLDPSVESLKDLILATSPESEPAFGVASSPQSLALTWLSGNQFLESDSTFRQLQRFVLATLYHSTRGETWLQDDRWLSDADECNWYQSETENDVCTAEGTLLEIDLDNNSLSGSLPWTELAILKSELMVLDVFANGLSGSISTMVGELTSLIAIDLQQNDIIGTLPIQLQELTSLQFLLLADNALSGTIPAQFSQMTSLKSIRLSRNSFRGTIATELGLLTNLQSVYLVSQKVG